MDEVQSESPGEATAASGGSDSKTPDVVKVAKQFSLPAIGFCMASQPESSLVYMGLSDFSIHKADLSTEPIQPAPLTAAAHTSYVTGLVRCGNVLISGGYDCSLIWSNIESGEIIRRVPDAHARWIRMLAVTPDQTRVASVADDMKTRLWDVASGACIATWGDYEIMTPHGFPSMLYAVACSADGRWLATGDRTGRIFVRDLSTGEITARIETPILYTWDPVQRRHSIGGVRSPAFSSDSRRLAVGGMGKVGNIDHLEGVSRIEVFNWPTAERLFEIEDSKHRGLVEALQFSPDDSFLVAAGGDNSGFVSVYETTKGTLVVQDKVPMQHVHDFELSPNGRSLTAVGHHQGVVIDLFAS
jgi:WD40 repeat protein